MFPLNNTIVIFIIFFFCQILTYSTVFSAISYKGEGYYVDNKQLIKCSSESDCTTIIEPGDYFAYIDASRKSNNKYSNVITCVGNICSSQSGSTGRANAYINGEDPSKVIWCNSSDGCKVRNTNATENEKKYYINALNNKKIIICTNTLCSITESGAKKDEHPNTKYYMNGVNNIDIIRCSSINCYSNAADSSSYGYYVNYEENDEATYFQCDHVICKIITPTIGSCSDSGNVGKLIKLSESSPVKLCININNDEALEIKSYGSGAFFRISDGFAGIDGISVVSFSDTSVYTRTEIYFNKIENSDNYGLNVTICDLWSYKCRDDLAVVGEYYEYNGEIYLTTEKKMEYIGKSFGNIPAGLYVNHYRDYHFNRVNRNSYGITWHPTSCSSSNVGRFYFENKSYFPKLCLDYDKSTETKYNTQETEAGTFLMKLGIQNVFEYDEGAYVIVSVSSHKYNLVTANNVVYCINSTNRKASLKGDSYCPELQTTCTNNVCTPPEMVTFEVLSDGYINACVSFGCEKYHNGALIGESPEYKYYLNGDELIACWYNYCNQNNAYNIQRGYYVNRESTVTIYYLCNSKVCKKIIPAVGSCSDSGNLGKLVKNTESSPVKICINTNDDEAVEFKEYEIYKNKFRSEYGFADIDGISMVVVDYYRAYAGSEIFLNNIENSDNYGLNVTICDLWSYKCRDDLAVVGEYYLYNDDIYETTQTKMKYIGKSMGNIPAGLYVNHYRDYHIYRISRNTFSSTWHPTSCSSSSVGRFYFENENEIYIPKLCLDYNESTNTSFNTQESDVGTFLMKLGEQNVFEFNEGTYVIVSVDSHKYNLVTTNEDEDTIYCVKQNRKATIKGNKSCTELQTTCRNSICSEPVQSTHEAIENCESSFTVCESTIINNANGYCISSDNKIYGYNNSGCLGILNEGVHVFVMNNESIEEINLSNITDENIKNIVIYNCDSNKICKRTFGYINIESNYYVLSYSNNGSKIDYINSEISCTDINNGKLIKINDTVRLCIDEGVSVSFNDSTSPQNYIMKNDGSSIFTSAISDGIVIKSESNTLTFNNLYTDEQYCSYGTNLIQDRYSNFCNGEALNTLYDCNEGLCKITEHYLEVGIYLIENSIYECILPNNSEANDENSNVICNPSTMTGMMAFIADDEDITTYSRLINDLSDIENPENIKLYDCQKGKCDITEGYIKYDNSTSIASCDLNGCVPINSSNSSMECSKSNVGEVVVTNTNSFKICIQISGTTDYEATGELSNSGYTYSVTNDSNKYNLYISGNHGNIIGKFKIGGYDLYDIDNDNINDLVYCSISDLCQKSDKKGYFLNSRSQNSNDSLIFMDSESRYENGINGYYINSSNEVIICDSNSCEVKNEINIVEDCNNNKNTVVSINNILKYCNDNNIISFLDKNSSFDYYVYSEVDSRGIDYPKIIPTGSESIVLSVGQYEVKQYIASSEDKTLCINKHKSVTCTSGFDQYICNNNNLSCAILPNGGCNPLAELPLAKCNGYYLVKNDSFVRDTETDHSTLWNCKKNRNGNVTCNPEDISRGYFKVIDTDYASIVPYIKCNEINDCQGLEVSTETSSCNTVGIGNLIFDDSKVKICITDDVTTPVMAEFLSAKYFISIASETIFSEADTSENKQDKYTMITLNETSITLSQEHKIKYRYAFSEQKVEISSGKACGEGNEKIGQLYEFKRVENNKNTYIKSKKKH